MGNSASRQHEASLDSRVNGFYYRVKFKPRPFDQGACRLAFKGRYVGTGPKNGQACVTKVFIDEAARHYKNYTPDKLASKKADEFAALFNLDYSSSKPLRFVVPKVATVVKVGRANPYVRPGDRILVENFIEGSYDKFNNNAGWCRDVVAAIPAFSHYTYWKSDGALLVCDIQGVRTSTGYTLTDPAVHSRQAGQYGPTDLGPVGMAWFFQGHRCSSVCMRFPLPVVDGYRKINRGRANRRASSYTFMLRPEEEQANSYYGRRNNRLPAITE